MFYLNSTDPDEMPPCRDLHWLPKYLFTGRVNQLSLALHYYSIKNEIMHILSHNCIVALIY